MDFSADLIIKRIKERCELKELEQFDISVQTISNWKTRNSIPRSDDLYKIAKYLNVSMEWLLTGENPNNELPKDIQKSVAKMLTLSETQRESINMIINAQVEFWKKFSV